MASNLHKLSQIFSTQANDEDTKKAHWSSSSSRKRKRDQTFGGCILRRWMPLSGAVSYTALSLNIFHPQGLNQHLKSLHGPLANSLLFNSHLGIGVYLFFRPHIRTLPSFHRVMFSVYGSVLFNFGSILLWLTTKSVILNISHSWWVRSIFAVSSAVAMLIIGREYVKYVDARARC